MLTRQDFRNYQHISYEFVQQHRRCGLFIKMGGGKTVVAATLVKDLQDNFECHRALVVSTVSNVTATWPLQLKEWEHLKGMTTTTLREPDNKTINAFVADQWSKRKAPLLAYWEEKHGKGKIPALTKEWKKRWKLRHRSRWYRMKSQEETDMHLINAENFHLFCDEMTPELWPYDVVIFDESTLFGSAKSNRFKKYKRLAHLPERVILLSGSAFARGAEAVWSQMYLIDGGKTLGRNVTVFHDRYFKPHPRIRHKYDEIPELTEPAIREAIKPHCMFIDPTEHLDTQEDIHSDVFVTMTQKQKKQLAELERELYLEVESGEVEAANAAVLVNKLRQFCNGFLYLDDDGNYEELHAHKLDKLVELVEEIGAPTLIAYEYQADLQRIQSVLPEARVFDGSSAMVELWNSGEYPQMLMNPLSTAHGLNLQHGGHHGIWYNPIWSLELTEQWEARIGKVRQAQAGYKRPSYFYRILEDGDTERRVMQRLASKFKFQEMCHAHIKQEF